MSDIFHFRRGTAPLLISIPHLGTEIPPEQRDQMTQTGLRSGDADWHLDRLYAFADALGASVLKARYSRYVVDLNRPPNDEHLYPGQTKTGLCPTHSFRGEPLYHDESVLTDAERARRLQTYWQPYHDQLAAELARLKAEHGVVLLWEAHSIASVLPRLFDGKLPDLNVGTSAGSSCAAEAQAAVQASLQAQSGYTWAVNGRFKGGYITRQYGAPAQGIHAIQLEMCQSTYMNEDYPYEYRPATAAGVIPVVESMVRAAFDEVLKQR
ncbi:N-formylglutamate deformylase [Bordetella sp. 2513F-2]